MTKYRYRITKHEESSYAVEGVGGILELPDFISENIISVLEDYQFQENTVEISIKTDSYTYEFVKTQN